MTFRAVFTDSCRRGKSDMSNLFFFNCYPVLVFFFVCFLILLTFLLWSLFSFSLSLVFFIVVRFGFFVLTFFVVACILVGSEELWFLRGMVVDPGQAQGALPRRARGQSAIVQWCKVSHGCWPWCDVVLLYVSGRQTLIWEDLTKQTRGTHEPGFYLPSATSWVKEVYTMQEGNLARCRTRASGFHPFVGEGMQDEDFWIAKGRLGLWGGRRVCWDGGGWMRFPSDVRFFDCGELGCR